MPLLNELLVALSVIVFVTWIYLKKHSKKTYLENIVSPPGLPILGHALDVIDIPNILNVLKKYINYGKFLKIQFGPFHTVVLIADYNILKFLLSSQKVLEKGDTYKFLNKWLGSSLITSKSEKWRKLRRIIAPSFYFKILEDFFDIFESCGEKLIEKLKKYDKDESFDIYPFITLCTLDIICETAMGISINAKDNEKSEYVQSVKEMSRILLERSTSILQYLDFLYPLTKNYYIEKKALTIIKNQTSSVISTRIKQLENNKNKFNTESKDDMGIKQRKAFLDMLLEATIDGRPLTQKEIRQEVDTIMLAGHDSTSAAISFILYNIAKYPQVQKQVYEEQCSIFEDLKNPQISYSNLQNMKYLEKVIKETLRLYPPVPLYTRQIKEPVEFDGGVLPPNVDLVVCSYAIQRDPQYFKDPETFNPNRFDDIDGKFPFAFIPFSAGPRNCIGQKFAMLVMKSIVAKILRNFELFPAIPQHNMILVPELVLKSANGVKLGIKARK